MTTDTSLPLTAHKLLQERLKVDYCINTNWGVVGRLNGISGGMAWRIVHEGYEPKDNKIRTRLGLSEFITVEVTRNDKGRFT